MSKSYLLELPDCLKLLPENSDELYSKLSGGGMSVLLIDGEGTWSCSASQLSVLGVSLGFVDLADGSVLLTDLLEDPVLERSVLLIDLLEDPVPERSVLPTNLLEDPVLERSVLSTNFLEDPVPERSVLPTDLLEDPVPERCSFLSENEIGGGINGVWVLLAGPGGVGLRDPSELGSLLVG